MEAHIRMILFLIVMIPSATEAVENLTGTEGGSITLPDPVVELGFLSFERKNVAMVDERKLKIYEEIYKNRLHWDKNTGLFTITGLQRNDSAIYTIDSKKGRTSFTSYKLTVYESVSHPAVNTLSVNAESCILLCSVEKAEETTLLWYKDEEILNQSSSALSLPLTVHKQDFSSSYRCVAANPAENKTLPVNSTTFCRQRRNTDNSETNKRNYFMTGIIISSVLTVFVVLIAIITKKKCLNKTKTTTRQTQDSVNTDTEVHYTDIQISDNRHCQAGNVPDSAGTVDRSNLTTVYDKLEIHRMLHTDTAENVSDQLSTYSNFATNH